MLAKSLTSPLLAAGISAPSFASIQINVAAARTSSLKVPNFTSQQNLSRRYQACPCSIFRGRRMQSHSVDEAAAVVAASLTEDEQKTWEEAQLRLAALDLSTEESNKTLEKAFGWLNSPYWSEERKREVPTAEKVGDVLNYITSLGLTDEDLRKLLKKFPEVLGCDLEKEMKPNVLVLEKDWGIEGKSLRSLLLRNPKVLGYNVDCRGDCMAKCTRCWVRF